MVSHNWARYLAPIALAAVAGGTYAIVHSGLKVHHAPVIPLHVSVVHKPVVHNKLQRAKFYTVQPNDSLSSIAAKAGISLQGLEALNPNVPPNSLQTGQHLRLRR
jgi:LysM repeat protein